MKKKSWYTLLELMIVIVILGLLAALGRSRLSNFDTNKYNAERCFNQIYGELASFFYYASTSKLLTDQNGQDIMPDDYRIWIESQPAPNENLIDWIGFSYIIESTESILKQLATWNTNHCQKGESYKVELHHNGIHRINMLPGIKRVGNQMGMRMIERTSWGSNVTHFTGAWDFKFCSPANSTPCYDFAKILFDSRIGSIRKAFCKYYHTDENSPTKDRACKERSTNF